MNKSVFRLILQNALIFAFIAGHIAYAASIFGKVQVSPASFNPSAGQTTKILFSVSKSGKINASIFDRDGFAVKNWTLPVTPGKPQEISWDGKDDSGAVLPDEAYTIRLQMGKQAEYNPALHFVPTLEKAPARSYSAVSGTLTYTVKQPSRVHIQAGLATKQDGVMKGCVIASLVDRAPRPTGSIVEAWDGYDATKKIYLPDQAHFVIAIVAESLPQNSIILTGNRKSSFLEYGAAHHKGSPQLKLQNSLGAHHAGLNSVEDRDPDVALEIHSPSPVHGIYPIVASSAVQFRASIDTRKFPHFLKYPNELQVFVDTRQVKLLENPKSPSDLSVSFDGVPDGKHMLTVNWISKYGPVGASSVMVFKGKTQMPSGQGQ